MKKLTNKQADVLEYCIAYYLSEDNLPSQRTMAEWMGRHKNAARAHMVALAKKGYIEKSGPHFKFRRDWPGRPIAGYGYEGQKRKNEEVQGAVRSGRALAKMRGVRKTRAEAKPRKAPPEKKAGR